MLATNTYAHDFIDHCRSMMDSQLTAFEVLNARPHEGGDDDERFETLLCNHLIIVLDAYFVNRTRGIEGKDGNPMNEVRMLAASILHHDGVFTADTSIRYKQDTAVLGLALGDTISLTVDQVRALTTAYFDAIQERFTAA